MVGKLDPSASSPGEMRLARRIGFSGGDRGVGFDDLVFASSLHKVIVPAGGTGNLELIDPESMAASSIRVGVASKFRGGHDDGITSADSDGTSVFALDRSAGRLVVVNPSTASVLASVALSGHPDYVRWVGATKEVWVADLRGGRNVSGDLILHGRPASTPAGPTEYQLAFGARSGPLLANLLTRSVRTIAAV